jgi:hypothetical protein
VKVLGKNKFNKNSVTTSSYINYSTGATGASGTGGTASEYIFVEPSAQYTLSGLTYTYGAAAPNGLGWYDSSKTYISGVTFSNINGNGTYTSPSNAKYLRITVNSVDLNTAQLEKSASATTFDEYRESVAYLPPVGNRVSSVYDEVSITEGWKKQNVSNDDTIDGNLNWSIITDKGNGYYTANNTSWIVGKNIVLATADSANVRNADYIFKTLGAGISTYQGNAIQFVNSSTMIISLDKTKIDAQVGADLNAKIKAYLTINPVTLNYQLATPIVTKLPSQRLTAYPNGTLFVEPVVLEEKVYGTNIAIGNTTMPIKSFDFINKIVNGVMTSVDMTTATIAGDGLSFTLSGASNGDTYEYAYYYDQSLSTIPSVYYSYPTNMRAELDNAVTAVQRVDDKVDDLNNFVLAQLIAMNSLALRGRPIEIKFGTVSATSTFIVKVARTAAYLNKAILVSQTGVTASDTDYWTIVIINKGSDYSKSNTIVTKTTKTTGGTAIAANTVYDLGTLDSTNKNLVTNDVVYLVLTKTGNPAALTDLTLALEAVPNY